MPGMDGIELLKSCQPRSGQCFIVLSCFNEYDYVREAMKLGAMDYLFKPLMEKEDIEKVLLEAEEKLGYSMQADQIRQHEDAVQNALQAILEKENTKGLEQLQALEPEIVSFPFFTLCITLPDRNTENEKAYAILDSCRALISGFFSAFSMSFPEKGQEAFLPSVFQNPAAGSDRHASAPAAVWKASRYSRDHALGRSQSSPSYSDRSSRRASSRFSCSRSKLFSGPEKRSSPDSDL